MTTADAIALLQSAMAHGGKREGSGRTRGRKTVRRQFSIDLDVDEMLRSVSNRSRFVNDALRHCFSLSLIDVQATLEKKPKRTKRREPK